MKRAIPVVIVLALSMGVVLVTYAQQGDLPPANPGCTPHGTSHLSGQSYPTNGLEPEFPVWCYTQRPAGAATRQLNGNTWIDTWDNLGRGLQTLNDGDYDYRVFNELKSSHDRFKFGYFINTDHWMIDLVDVSPFRLSGGIMVSPDKQFLFDNGKFVVEVDAAAGSDGMGGANRFYEIDLTPAMTPTGVTTDDLYGYGAFGGTGALGCRLERNDSGGNFVCAMYDNSGRVTGGQCPNDGRVCKNNGGRPGRVWETQGVGTARTARSVQGGFSNYLIPGGGGLRLNDVWRQCGNGIHDLHCRDRFRMEVTKDSIHLFVNGYPAMQIDGLFAVNPDTGADNRIPDFWFTDGVRPYFTSWINGGQHEPIRWHWNEVRVNPHDPAGNPAQPSASPSFCLGNTLADGSRNTCSHQHVPGQPEIGVAPVSTPNETATETPTAEPTDTSTPTVLPVATETPTPSPTSLPAVTATPLPCMVNVKINGVERGWVPC